MFYPRKACNLTCIDSHITMPTDRLLVIFTSDQAADAQEPADDQAQ